MINIIIIASTNHIGSDALTITQLFTFVKEHSKVLILAPGCDEKFDKIAYDFMKNKKMRNELLKEAEGAIKKVECEEVKNSGVINTFALLNTYIFLYRRNKLSNFIRF